MLKILIADDHPVVRQGLKHILSECRDILVADEASSGQEVVAKILKNDYDVILLDISMPGRDGIDTLKEIKALRPKLPVLILSVHSEESYGQRALRSGASGYLTKRSAPDELVAAIRKIALGGQYVSESMIDKLSLYLKDKDATPLHRVLSDREYQVMLMIASGKTVSEIAAELKLSVKTISTHRSHILTKLCLKNNAEITHYVLRSQLIE